VALQSTKWFDLVNVAAMARPAGVSYQVTKYGVIKFDGYEFDQEVTAAPPPVSSQSSE